MSDAQGSPALTILPADLKDRARRNKSGNLGDPTVGPVYPGSPATTEPARPVPAPAAPPPPSPALHAVREADEDLTVPRTGEQPTEHVLRLASDVRMLRHALDEVRKQLADAVAACTLESIARKTAEAEAATARASAQADLATARAAAQGEYASARAALAAELADVRADLQRANAVVARLTAEAEQLRQAIDGAHRQADQWSEKAGQAEMRLKAALLAAESAADDRAKLEAALAERDAANRRVAQLEEAMQHARTPHPRANIRSLSAPGLPTDVPAAPDGMPLIATRGAGVATDVHEEHPVSLATEIALDPWQEDALGAWGDAGYRGVVESVTTDGNLRLAFWAIGRALDNDMKVLVLAPSQERVDHWYDELRAVLPISRVAKHAGGRGNARLAAYDVVVATAQAATKEHTFEPGLGVLAVFDEVHEFGSESLSKALDPAYPWRLGLTSSYERDDDGVAMYLDRYFGGAVFRLGYDRAINEQVIASFDLAMVSVPLSDPEQNEHDACAAATLAGSGGAKAAVRAYLKAVARRDEILAGTTARDSVLRSLAAVVRNAGKALVIAPSAQVAAHVDRVFVGQGCVTIPARIGFDGEARNRRGGKAEDERDSWMLVGPRGWDQPHDATDVELAIVISPARTRRQLIERMDRILGGKPQGFHVRMVVLYIEASVEDDTVNEEARAITAAWPKAKRMQRFTAGDTDGLYEFLVSARRIVTLPPDPTVDPASQRENV
ncbi:MAG TPA: DEAD/DEAH box helicase family protein [Mycobacteriales bacterium]|nr:DEAD/DEAH box helicase family protein [Mycobacteriales bacterium]